MNRLQIGDTIKCHDPEDMINTDRELLRGGYWTEFEYQQDGVKGYWIRIIGYQVEDKKGECYG